MTQKRICLGQIGAANGIKGHVRLKSFTEIPEAFGDYGRLENEEKTETFKISTLRPLKGNMLVVKFKGINDRNEAERLNGTKLYVDRTLLPDLSDDDDFYVEDLIGLKALNENDEELGTIITVHNFGAGDLLDIKPEKGPSLLIPFTKKAVPNLSLSNGLIVIDEKEAGLLSEGDISPDNERDGRDG